MSLPFFSSITVGCKKRVCFLRLVQIVADTVTPFLFSVPLLRSERMIITQSEPFTLDEVTQLKAEFDIYIKTVIDIEKKICSAGMNRHFEGEQILLQQGSRQSNIWGGGVDLETKEIDFNSFINIRPRDNNTKNEIQSEEIKRKYKQLMEYFFKVIL